MYGTALRESENGQRVAFDRARLLVGWRERTSRLIEPVGCLERFRGDDGEATYEFRYLRTAIALDGFRPFICFPDLYRSYRSTHLFPFFENRLMPRGRADYASFMRTLGLDEDADPFAVLARSEGRRQTDEIEVFAEPTLQGGVARGIFWVRGIRELPGSAEAVTSLAVGDHLFALADAEEGVDGGAVLLRDGDFRPLGWVPGHLAVLIRQAMSDTGPDAVSISVEHVGAGNGPVDLLVLCGLQLHWPQASEWPFEGPEFEVVAATDNR